MRTLSAGGAVKISVRSDGQRGYRRFSVRNQVDRRITEVPGVNAVLRDDHVVIVESPLASRHRDGREKQSETEEIFANHHSLTRFRMVDDQGQPIRNVSYFSRGVIVRALGIRNF